MSETYLQQRYKTLYLKIINLLKKKENPKIILYSLGRMKEIEHYLKRAYSYSESDLEFLEEIVRTDKNISEDEINKLLLNY